MESINLHTKNSLFYDIFITRLKWTYATISTNDTNAVRSL